MEFIRILFYRRSFFYFLCALLVFLGQVGCSHCDSNVFIRKDYARARVRRVAVFPFYNETKNIQASKIVTGVVIAALLEKEKFQVEYPGNVINFLIKERIIVRDKIDLDTIKLMGKRLGVDAVILGRVEEFSGMEEMKTRAVPLVAISLRMLDARTGKILYMARLRRTGNDYITIIDFGKIRSVGALVKKVVGELIDKLN